MKVFVSWSGERSRFVAFELSTWLRRVIQALEPWMSAKDIISGAVWQQEIKTQLTDAKFGIICLTPENLTAPWIMFEAGALANAMARNLVCPYLVAMTSTIDIEPPLDQFQAEKADKDGTLNLLRGLNLRLADLGERPLKDGDLNDAFEHYSPDLEKKLATIPALTSPTLPRVRSDT